MNKHFFTVGEISKITGISKQTIRYYDKIGLLPPAKIDAQNAYRYYEPIHVLYLNTIMRLSKLGCSLKETGNYLYGNDIQNIKDMLHMRKSLTEQRIYELKFALNALENQIRLIDEGVAARKCNNIEIKEVPKRCFIYLHNTQPIGFIQGIMQINELVRILYQQGMLFVESPVMEMSKSKSVIKAGFFYNEDVQGESIHKVILPEGRYACIYHQGPYNQLPNTTARFIAYLDANGLKPQSNFYLLYLIDYALTQVDDELLTEIQVRI